jgi:hypothetical protein
MSEPTTQGPAALCLLANVSASDQPPDCELNLGLGPTSGNLDYNVGSIKPEDAAASMAGSGETSKGTPPATQDQGSSAAELVPVVVAQSVLVDGQLSGSMETPRIDIAPTYQHQGVVVHGLRSLTVHTMSYGAGDGPGSIGGAPSQQQQQKDRLKEKQKKYRHRQGQLVRELGELLPAGSGMRSLNQILTAAVSQVRSY